MSIDREVPSEGAFAVSRRRRLATVRRQIARIPGAKRLYRALWTLRFEARVLRARVVRGSSADEQPPAASIVWQRPRKFAPGADIPAADVYPSGSLVKTITGELSDLHARLLAANVLFEAGLGPRVYDAWAATGQSPNLAFAVDNLTPAADANGVEEARRGIERLLAAGALAERTNGWRSIEHFGTGSDDASARCRDFEYFDVPNQTERLRRLFTNELESDLHFGREARVAGGRYLYQSVPGLDKRGRRNSDRRWARISEMLSRAGVTVEDRLVLDVGCNAGMMMAAALRDGAAWTLGWDLPIVATRARQLLFALGCTRFDLFGCQLATDYSLAADVPKHLASRVEGSLVLYLAIRHHVGFLEELASMPWRALVYEGGETEAVRTLDSTLAELRAKTEFEMVAAENFRDGEGDARPLAVLARSQPPLSSDVSAD